MLPFISDAITGISNLAGKFIEDKDKKNEFIAQAEQQMRQLDNKVVSYQRDIIVAEAKSQSYLARNWRPIMMLAFVAVIINNYMLAPYLKLFGVPFAVMEIPPDMWDLLKLGISGYIVERSAEKGIEAWKGKE